MRRALGGILAAWRRGACLVALGWAVAVSAQPEPSRVAEVLAVLDRPLHAEQIALSPDGGRVAYTVAEPEGVRLRITRVDTPEIVYQRAVEVGEPGEKTVPVRRLIHLQWLSDSEVLYAAPSALYLLNITSGRTSRLAGSGVFLGSAELKGRTPHRRWAVRQWDAAAREVLVEGLGYPQGREALHSTVFAVQVDTRSVRQLDSAQRSTWMLLDRAGRLRAAVVLEPGTTRHYVEHRQGDAWRRLRAGEFAWSADTLHGERSIPLGFGADPDVLYYASNVGRDTYGIYTWSLAQGRRLAVVAESEERDLAPLESVGNPLICDPSTGAVLGIRPGGQHPAVWFDAERARLTTVLREKLPRREIDIRGWDRAAERFLVFARGERDLGRYFVYDKAQDLLIEVAQTAPDARPAKVGKAAPFVFQTRAGHRLHGVVTQPVGAEPGKALPVVLLCPPGLFEPAADLFAPEAQFFARLGYLAVQVEHRGRHGFGARHRAALPRDTVAGDDLAETLDWLARTHAVDGQRVFTFGVGYGGFLAIRALQAHPTRIRGAIALNAPLDPAASAPPVMPWMDVADLQIPEPGQRMPPSLPRMEPPYITRGLERATFARKPRVRPVALQPLPGPVLSVVDGATVADEAAETVEAQAQALHARERERFTYVKIAAPLSTQPGRLAAFSAVGQFLKVQQAVPRLDVGPLTPLP